MRIQSKATYEWLFLCVTAVTLNSINSSYQVSQVNISIFGNMVCFGFGQIKAITLIILQSAFGRKFTILL